ncbi:MAG: DHA2 family efflux MFS transporter permease subunit [Actinobacteria bacterium]|nr:DHA2 family efflux MFS transporter permease subunit [Actinomycetota bacterium]
MNTIPNATTPVAVLDDAQRATRRRERLVLFSTGLAVFAVFLDTTIGFVTFQAIGRTFPTSPSTLSWVLNAYTLVFGAMLIPAGRLADRIGRKRVFLMGVVVFTIGSMACGLAPSLGLLIAAEALEAVGAALLVPASLALLLRSFDSSRIPVVVAIWGAISAAAGAAGPPLGAFLVGNFSWRWAFFINLPVGIFSYILGRRVLSESREAEAGRLPDALSVGLLALGMASLTLAIVQTDEWGWTSVKTIAAFVVGVALMVSFVLRAKAIPNPVLRLELFHNRDFSWANIAALVFAIGFNAMFLSNVLFLTTVWDYSIERAGLAIAVGPAIVALTAPRFGRLAGRVGQRALLIPGGLVYGASGFVLLARVGTEPSYFTQYLPAVICSALGVAMCFPQFSSAAAATLPADQYGSGSAVVQATRYLGGSFGIALVIAFTGASVGIDGFRHVWILIAAVGVIVSLASTRLTRRYLST